MNTVFGEFLEVGAVLSAWQAGMGNMYTVSI